LNFLTTFYPTLSILLTIFSGFIIYLTLVLIKQNWVNTLHYFLTFLLLPITTFVITKVISNNLALSLGMIGALSIVRFRNPVKNPLELIMYFALITSGISYGVNIKWGLLMSSIVVIVLIFSKLFEFIVSKTNLNLFNYSFATNDNEQRILFEIESSKKIKFLEEHKNIEYFSKNGDVFFYKISLKKIDEVNSLKNNLLELKDISNIEIRYN
jgi:hypothetical protein